jgi:hypothetical protein
VVHDTGEPALVAYVMDSDAAHVDGLGPAGVRWTVYLHPDLAAAFGAPSLSQSAGEAVEQALAWSAEAGLTADPAGVRTALSTRNTFVEEALTQLLTALGIAG